jgi:hypothetical protein
MGKRIYELNEKLSAEITDQWELEIDITGEVESDKIKVSELLNFVPAIDSTRINDTADTTYVDTDEIADTVIIKSVDKTTIKSGSTNTHNVILDIKDSIDNVLLEVTDRGRLEIYPTGGGATNAFETHFPAIPNYTPSTISDTGSSRFTGVMLRENNQAQGTVETLTGFRTNQPSGSTTQFYASDDIRGTISFKSVFRDANSSSQAAAITNYRSFISAIAIDAAKTITNFYGFTVLNNSATITNAYGFVADTDYLNGFGTLTPVEVVDVVGNVNATGVYKVSGTQVLTSQQPAIADATGTATGTDATMINELKTQLNLALAMLRTHGLIA